MCSDEIAIEIEDISKCYHVYESPAHRLKQFIVPRLRRLIGLGVVEYFTAFWALNDVSLTIKKGQTVGIVGRNGSGKSTFLQIICGTLNPSLGTVKINGRIAALLELGSGFNPEFSGRENIYINAAVLGLTKAEIDERFEDIVRFADIGSFIDQPVKIYSSGMLMRVAFSVAINVEPEILIIDEALSVGDELFQRKCFSKIEEIKEGGATILFVSHASNAVVELCDSAVLLDGGEMIATGLPKSIIGLYQKLLYADEATAQALREQLKISKGRIENTNGMETEETHADSVMTESFDENLIPTSTIEYQSHGARISAPMICTLDGQQVNNLVRGETYVYSYSCSFTRTFEKVTFGMMIKTLSGVELGGGTSSNRYKGEQIEVGTNINVNYTFTCTLNSGLYFLNAGILGLEDGEEKFLHRIVDALCFRVQEDSSQLVTGIVDFSCQPEILRTN